MGFSKLAPSASAGSTARSALERNYNIVGPPQALGYHASCVAYDAKLQLGGLTAPPRAECAGVKSRPGDEHSEPTLDARAPRAPEPGQIQKVVTYVLNEYTALFSGEVLDRLEATALNALHLLTF